MYSQRFVFDCCQQCLSAFRLYHKYNSVYYLFQDKCYQNMWYLPDYDTLGILPVRNRLDIFVADETAIV